jgi:allantoin racemase
MVAYDQPFDAVIQAGYGEHGREGLQELLNVPVVDITKAAASTAMFLGHAYSVVTTLDRTVPLIEDRLKLSGLWDRCASVRASGLAVLELESDPERALEAIVRQAELAVLEDKAEVICLGCCGMAGLDEQIRQRTGVPVVDGVTAAVTIAESLVRLGLSTSKVRTYATPRPKKIVGWPRRFAGRPRYRSSRRCGDPTSHAPKGFCGVHITVARHKTLWGGDPTCPRRQPLDPKPGSNRFQCRVHNHGTTKILWERGLPAMASPRSSAKFKPH